MSTLISITTFRKNLGLEQLLETLLEHGYAVNSTILIADDGAGEAKPVYDALKGKCRLVYVTGDNPQQGVAVNKNRGLRYFQQKSHFKAILNLDDDLLFKRAGLIEHMEMVCEEIRLPFISGYWTDFEGKKEENVKQVTNRSWYADFPIEAETEWATFHRGCQGVSMYMKRSAFEKVGYMTKFDYYYGYEHSEYFNRLMRAHHASPELYPVMKYSEYFYIGNNIPNCYSVDLSKVFGPVDTNASQYDNDFFPRIVAGTYIYNKESGLKKKKETIIESF